jgi:hypothetical protein
MQDGKIRIRNKHPKSATLGTVWLTDGDDIPVGLPLQLILDTTLAAEGDVHVLRLLVRLPVVHELDKSGQTISKMSVRKKGIALDIVAAQHNRMKKVSFLM